MRPPYATLPYAATLAHVGRPVDLPPWGSAVLLRTIPTTSLRTSRSPTPLAEGEGRDAERAEDLLDAMGPYPVCTLAADADIAAGLAMLRTMGALSVVLVADALAGPDATRLARHFPLCRPFKTHHLVDRRLGRVEPSKHHRDRIRRGERHATARIVDLRDGAWHQQWCALYAGLAARKGLTGLHAFPGEAFARLAALPGLVAFAAEASDGSVLAMQLWIRHGSRAYSHLTATSEAGYRLGATFVVYAAAIAHFADCEVLDLGGGAGTGDDPADSLAAFKRGFANAAAPAHLCGAVLDPAAYARLAAGRDDGFFPAYRSPAPRQEAA